MKLSKLILSVLFCVIFASYLQGCGSKEGSVQVEIGGGEGSGDDDTSVTDVGNPFPENTDSESPTENQEPTEEEPSEEEIAAQQEAELKAKNLTSLSELSGKSEEEIESLASEMNIKLGKTNSNVNGKLLQLIAKIDDAVQSQSDELFHDNYTGLDVDSIYTAGELKAKLRPYLEAIYPDLEIQEYPKGMTAEEKEGKNILEIILIALAKGIKSELFYDVDGKCISFVRFGEVNSDKMSHDDTQTKGALSYIDCSYAFIDPMELNIGSIQDQINNGLNKIDIPSQIKTPVDLIPNELLIQQIDL